MTRSRRRAACWAWAATIALVSPCAAQEGPCGEERLARHRQWQTRTPARPQPSTTSGEQVRHLPTATLGIWVVETVGPAEVSMTQVSSDRLTRVSWTSPACRARAEERARPRVPAPAFHDDDLSALIGTGRGVIHVWSPHMPLSVDAIGPLTIAARAEGLSLTLLLDPAADRRFAARVAADHGLPAAALRVADSVELQFRDVLVHAPTVQVYADGRLVGSAYPGGHTTEEYVAYFRRVLSAPPPR